MPVTRLKHMRARFSTSFLSQTGKRHPARAPAPLCPLRLSVHRLPACNHNISQFISSSSVLRNCSITVPKLFGEKRGKNIAGAEPGTEGDWLQARRALPSSISACANLLEGPSLCAAEAPNLLCWPATHPPWAASPQDDCNWFRITSSWTLFHDSPVLSFVVP